MVFIGKDRAASVTQVSSSFLGSRVFKHDKDTDSRMALV